MRFTRSDVRDISFHPKSITDLPSSAEKRRSSRKVHRSTFARFLGLFDFRLLQHNPPEAAVPSESAFGARFRSAAGSCFEPFGVARALDLDRGRGAFDLG